MDFSRYRRQTALPEIGIAGQRKISSARVLVIGAGGLGCPVLQYLAGAGISRIGIVDFDRVDISNLQRQTLYTTNDAGKKKAEAAKAHLSVLNPDIDIEAYPYALTPENVTGIFSGYDIIVDGTDNFAAKYLINDTAVKTGKLVIFGAIQGFDGQIAVFNAAGNACYRCLYPSEPVVPVMNCAEAGVIGALAGIIGSMQAMEVIKIIVGDASFSPLAGRIMTIDARTMESRTVRISKRPDCPICSKNPDTVVISNHSAVCSAAIPRDIERASARKLKNALFIDVRERSEWDAGHIEGAKHLPLSALRLNTELFADLGILGECVLYCQRGARSRQAAEILLNAGYTDIYNLSGGYEDWCKQAA